MEEGSSRETGINPGASPGPANDLLRCQGEYLQQPQYIFLTLGADDPEQGQQHHFLIAKAARIYD